MYAVVVAVAAGGGWCGHRTCSVISVLCGIGDVRGRAVSFHGRSTEMAPEHYFENTYR